LVNLRGILANGSQNKCCEMLRIDFKSKLKQHGLTASPSSRAPEIVIAVQRAVATFTSSNGVGNR